MGDWRHSYTIFLTLVLHSGEWSRPCHITSGKISPGNNCTRLEELLGSRDSLDVMQKSLLPLPGIEPRFLGRAASSLVASRTQLSRLSSCQEFQI